MNNYYISAEELKEIIPTMGIKSCRKIIKDIRKEMEEQNYIIPTGKVKLALRSMVFEKLGIKGR